jgi:hypothetical protein
MVKIRYSELPAGLHVSAESHGRDTIIYLQPGLTAEQRRAALIRVRSSARMGHGPGLTAVGMVMAVSADKLRTTLSNGAAAMRGHPLLLLPPLILLVSGAIVFILMSLVTLTVPQHDGTSSAVPGLVVGSRHAHSQQPGAGPPSGRPVSDQGGPGPSPHGSVGGPRPTAGPTPTLSSMPSPTPTVTGPTSPPPVLSSPPPPTPSPSSAAPTPDPSPSPSQSPGTTCLQVGPLGLCLHL